MEFNEKLQQLRTGKNLTQEQLAEQLYVSRTAISKWESGKGYPNIESLKCISKFFSVTIDELLSGEELITLAETENRSNLKKIYSFIYGILDMMAVTFILLPLYGNLVDGYIYSVNLLSFTDTTPIYLAIYWIVFIVLIALGIAKLMCVCFEKESWSNIITKCSLVLSTLFICFFAAARQPYVFVMIGLYAGLRREEILALQWDSVYLDAEAPYLTVRRAWHTEHNRPVILTELKTKAAQRNIPLPVCLVECLKDAKKKSTSDYVIANRDGDPLSYTQFKRLWQYIVTRTAKPRMARKLVDGKYVKYMLYPKLGEKARNNGHVVYSLDFEVTPHQLRHTYITNLIHSSVDPKTVQYLAGHESSKITMDIYAKVKYNRPDDLVKAMGCAFDLWDAV